MEIPRHWRLKGLRLGVPSVWEKVLELYKDSELNPHLSLAHYASPLTKPELIEIHDRKKSADEKIVYERIA